MVRSGSRPVATAAGTSPDEALANVIERAEAGLRRGRQHAHPVVSDQDTR